MLLVSAGLSLADGSGMRRERGYVPQKETSSMFFVLRRRRFLVEQKKLVTILWSGEKKTMSYWLEQAIHHRRVQPFEECFLLQGRPPEYRP